MMTGECLWQAEDVLRAVRGSCLHEQSWTAAGVSIDSRTLKKGDLFIALKGPVYDGHDHVSAAFAAGASAAIVARQPSQVPRDAPLVFVEDTFTALNDLGRAGRARARATIIAVTGSVGKTSSKEMLRLALSACGKTYANPGSFNNHWGLPLSLANLPDDADYGVFELGMNHAGELTQLAALARPDIALITTIEIAHLEFFASIEAIADAKAEIFSGMPDNGIAVLNKDNSQYARLASAAKKQGVKKIMSFGSKGRLDARLIDCAVTSEGCAINASISGYNIHYALGAPGLHLAQNSLGVLLTCAAAGASIDTCAAALDNYRPPKGRGVIERVPLPEGQFFTLIDESYNASPSAVIAAIGVLAQMKPSSAGRRILVLGDMRELGPQAPKLHADLAPAVMAARIDGVFTCGEMMRNLSDQLPEDIRGPHTATSAELAPLVAQAIQPDDIVTVKGSLSVKMNRVVDELRSLSAAFPRKIAS